MSPEDAQVWAETVPLESAQALGRAIRRRRHAEAEHCAPAVEIHARRHETIAARLAPHDLTGRHAHTDRWGAIEVEGDGSTGRGEPCQE